MTLPYPVLDLELLRSAPDLFSRHYRVFAAIEAMREPEQRFSILDVGGRAGLTRRFFPRDTVTIVDIRSDQDDVVAVEPGEPLPFEDNEFDFVVSFDVLEHVNPEFRSAWIREAFRTCSRSLIFTVPDSSDEAMHAEIRANSFYQQLTGQQHPWLQEHVEFGVPARDDIASTLENLDSVWARASSNPVERWYQLMVLGFVRDYASDVLPEPESVLGANDSFWDVDGIEPGYRSIYAASRSDELLAPITVPAAPEGLVGPYEQGLMDLHRIERALREQRDQARLERDGLRVELDASDAARRELIATQETLVADNAQLRSQVQLYRNWWPVRVALWFRRRRRAALRRGRED